MTEDIQTIADLTPDPKNARRHNPRNIGMIERALNEVGAARSIVVDEDGVVLAGNGLIEAAAQAGIEQVRVVEASGNEIIAVRRRGLTAEQKAKLALYDNRTAELAEWEPGVLAEMAEDGVDLSALWFPDELGEVLAPVSLPEAGAGGDEFDTTPQDGPTRAQAGDLWTIGGVHRLIVGDCTDPAVVERLMGGERAEATITDPPYNVGADGRHESSYDIDVGKSAEFEHFDRDFDPLPFLDTVKEFQASNHNWFIFTLTYLAWSAYLPFLYGLYDVASLFVWGKHFTYNNVRGVGFAKAYELGVYAWNKGHYFEALTGPENYDMVVMSNNEGGRNYEHPTAKPLALIERLVRQLSPRDSIVLDPFLGSGTTLIAAHRTGRRCYGCEISPKYADVILRRAEAEGLECVKVDE